MFLNEQEVTVTANVKYNDGIIKNGSILILEDLRVDEEGLLFYRFKDIDLWFQAMCVFVPTKELTDEEIINWTSK